MDPRDNNNEAFRMAVKYGNHDAINTLLEDPRVSLGATTI